MPIAADLCLSDTQMSVRYQLHCQSRTKDINTEAQRFSSLNVGAFTTVKGFTGYI